MNHTFSSVLDLVGNTPLVKLRHINPNKNIDIYVKLESANPGGSVKDRIALSMIEAAEKSGELTKNKTIVEATSGNTGIGLALVASVKGYNITLTMPETASVERQKIMRALGAHLLLTPGAQGTDGAIEKAYSLKRENPDKYVLLDQFNNENNLLAHYSNTGIEIWEQTEGKITAFVSALGTSGTVMGTGKRLKEYNEKIQIVAVEPVLGHKIQGLKNMKESYVPGIFNKKSLDHTEYVNDDEAFETSRRLAKEEGLFVGMSSGAAVYGALEYAKALDSGLVVVICPDGGERYLSTKLFSDATLTNIQLYDTLTRRKKTFKPINAGTASIYTCGPTADEHTTIINCRRYVFADLLRRYLEYNNFNVTHVINITDIDDNTILGSEKENNSLKEYTQHYIDAFLEDMDSLCVKRAESYPLASEYINDMISMVKTLVDKGYAYEKLGSVYFDISKIDNYGSLSNVNLNKIKVGITVDLDNYEKENPRDFTLLKRTTLDELKRGIYYKSDWGNVRPGWHIECATMSSKILGDKIDIHTGSKNLLFPHHENERALCSCLTHEESVNYWIHNETVIIDDEFKKLFNTETISLRDLYNKEYSPREIRFWFLLTHYRKQAILSEKSLFDAKRSLLRIDEFINVLMQTKTIQEHPEIDYHISQLEQCFNDSLNNDLNVTQAIAGIFEFIRKINSFVINGQISKEQKENVISCFKKINKVLSIFSFECQTIDKRIEKLISLRNDAREKKDWKTADSIRNDLQDEGIQLIDTPQGTQWRRVDKKNNENIFCCEL